MLAGLEEPIDNAAIAAAAAQAACEDANGTWESGTCTAGSSYNCTIGAICSAWAAAHPEDVLIEGFANNYVGDTAATTECAASEWSYLYSASLLYGYNFTLASYYCSVPSQPHVSD